MSERLALSPERIIDAAARVADERGLVGVSMRNVGRALGVEAMSLYHHIRNKEELLDALADWVFTQIELPALDAPWREAMTRRAGSARATLSGHPWGLGLIESRRTPGPALLRHHDTVLGCLRHNGFTVSLASHAFSAIDAYVYGFVLTELSLPFTPDEGVEAFATGVELPMDAYPHLSEMVADLVVAGDYAFADEFGYGLELILDALEARLAASAH